MATIIAVFPLTT